MVDWSFAERGVYRSGACRSVLICLQSRFPLGIESPWLTNNEWKETMGVETKEDGEGKWQDR